MKYVILSQLRAKGAPLQIVSGNYNPWESQETAEEAAKSLAGVNAAIDYFVAPLETKYSAKINVEETHFE